MSYVSVVFGSKVLFLLIVFKANLKASSSAPDGPLSMDSNIPPKKKRKKEKNTILLTCCLLSSSSLVEYNIIKYNTQDIISKISEKMLT